MGNIHEWFFPRIVLLLLATKFLASGVNINNQQLDKMAGAFIKSGMKVFNKKNYEENQVKFFFDYFKVNF
jgi:hypothetical protein